MNRLAFSAAVLGAVALAAGSAAAQTKYSGTAYGKVPFGGGGSCPTYQMRIDLTLTGNQVAATFQQKDRPQRNFAATTDAAGNFTTTAIVGGGDQIKVKGSVKADRADVTLDGYCVFVVPLKKI